MPIKSKRQPVQINESTMRRLRKFSEESGISMTFIVNQAVDHWLGTAYEGKQPVQKFVAKRGGVKAVREELTEKGIKGLVTR